MASNRRAGISGLGARSPPIAPPTPRSIAVRYARGERRVELKSGTALFEVAKEAARPFVVEADGATVRALGTRFEVRREDGPVGVTLLEGSVEVRPARAEALRSRCRPCAPTSATLERSLARWDALCSFSPVLMPDLHELRRVSPMAGEPAPARTSRTGCPARMVPRRQAGKGMSVTATNAPHACLRHSR